MADLRVAVIEAAKSSYADYLGLTNEEFNMGWVARYTSADAGRSFSSHAYAEARKLGYEIVHPLGTEAWGLRRFFVRAPDGNVISMVNRRD
jgi:hypothetical protein